MAALNLTIDRAPTNPKERANENFITVITKHVIIDNGTNKSEKYSLLESDCGDKKRVTCDTTKQFMDVLAVVTDQADPELIKYADLSVND